MVFLLYWWNALMKYVWLEVKYTSQPSSHINILYTCLNQHYKPNNVQATNPESISAADLNALEHYYAAYSHWIVITVTYFNTYFNNCGKYSDLYVARCSCAETWICNCHFNCWIFWEKLNAKLIIMNKLFNKNLPVTVYDDYNIHININIRFINE